jgi:hypothetical protein
MSAKLKEISEIWKFSGQLHDRCTSQRPTRLVQEPFDLLPWDHLVPRSKRAPEHAPMNEPVDGENAEKIGASRIVV